MITSLQSYVHTNSCQTHQTERQSRNQTCWHRFSINVNTTTVFITDVMKGKFPQFLSRSHREDDMSVPVLSRRKDGPQQSTGRRRIKADSHVACHAHAVPLPCRAAKGLECLFPIWFTQCGRVWFTLAMFWPCCSSQGHGTARPSGDGLWATCPRSASSGYHAEFHEDCYQKHTNPPHNDPYQRL